MKTAITNDRKAELKDIAEVFLNDQEFFEFRERLDEHAWEELVESEGKITHEELEWLRENAIVTLAVTIVETF